MLIYQLITLKYKGPKRNPFFEFVENCHIIFLSNYVKLYFCITIHTDCVGMED